MNRGTGLAWARRGISLIEALTAVTITTVAGAALLASVGAAVSATSGASLREVARGLAKQLMDEVASARFPDGSSPGSTDVTREFFDDIDDYHEWSSMPPVDRFGRALGTEGITDGSSDLREASLRPEADFMNDFRRRVSVERVEPDGSGGWDVVSYHTDYRRVTVAVDHVDAHSNKRTLVETSRIFGYAPATP